MLMLSGFFLTKEPHIHTLVESWTWSWDCCGHGQTEWETLYQKGTQTRQRRLVVSLWMCLIQVKPALGIGKTYELRLGGRGSRRGCYPPHLAKIWQRLSVALFDLEMNLILTPVQVCQAFQDICLRPTALIIKTPWLTSDLTRAWIFWCCNNQNSSPAKYSGLGGLAHHRCNLLTFFDRRCY